MAEKKFYWLKLKSDFFDDDTIRFIEEQENGIKYSNFYLKLCLKSLKTDGKLIRLVGDTFIPYDVNSLSKLTNVDIDTVRTAMQLFEQIGLIQVMESGEIYLSQINEMIGSETDKAQIMRRKRAEEKLNGNIVTKMLPKCYLEIEKEIEIEKDIEKESTTIKENKPEFTEVDIDEPKKVIDFYENNIGLLSPYQLTVLHPYIKELGSDMVILAIQKALEQNKKNLKYIEAIIKSWIANDIRTVADVNNADEEFKSGKNKEETSEERWKRLEILESG